MATNYGDNKQGETPHYKVPDGGRKYLKSNDHLASSQASQEVRHVSIACRCDVVTTLGTWEWD